MPHPTWEHTPKQMLPSRTIKSFLTLKGSLPDLRRASVYLPPPLLAAKYNLCNYQGSFKTIFTSHILYAHLHDYGQVQYCILKVRQVCASVSGLSSYQCWL